MKHNPIWHVGQLLAIIVGILMAFDGHGYVSLAVYLILAVLVDIRENTMH